MQGTNHSASHGFRLRSSLCQGMLALDAQRQVHAYAHLLIRDCIIRDCNASTAFAVQVAQAVLGKWWAKQSFAFSHDSQQQMAGINDLGAALGSVIAGKENNPAGMFVIAFKHSSPFYIPLWFKLTISCKAIVDVALTVASNRTNCL